ncbi:hypothetical protein Pmar_PMAR011919 [Perkinsus marinus ATCC 50983]|uniref:Uncharacterized protein n=1 Tax=Perkinsus marinus (strain ATCC 50983 / TXsc) TaxID=423536 RepID=C5LBP2_PERM5|nr:hypothetical protein Pmar_PMAR011919 [Perkinsus marinus ATCC 50983]EER05863.1 hypothetical protein Pmar_PMAR011919 [Perkinsus marinus ATCC 50983]|eukprot:XP_002774047.1 hypothetical protein Pmar_PMAR011919 [Perkinsus marinus ATCC 50983]
MSIASKYVLLALLVNVVIPVLGEGLRTSALTESGEVLPVLSDNDEDVLWKELVDRVRTELISPAFNHTDIPVALVTAAENADDPFWTLIQYVMKDTFGPQGLDVRSVLSMVAEDDSLSVLKYLSAYLVSDTPPSQDSVDYSQLRTRDLAVQDPESNPILAWFASILSLLR